MCFTRPQYFFCPIGYEDLRSESNDSVRFQSMSMVRRLSVSLRTASSALNKHAFSTSHVLSSDLCKIFSSCALELADFLDVWGEEGVCHHLCCLNQFYQLLNRLEGAHHNKLLKPSEAMSHTIMGIHKIGMLMLAFRPDNESLQRVVRISAYTPFVIKKLILEDNFRQDTHNLTMLAFVATTSFPGAPCHVHST